MDINEITAQKIKNFRIKLNYSAEDVAKEIGLDRSNYSKLENGKTEISMRKLSSIADFFKVPLQSFFPQNGQNINVTHGEHSPIQNAHIINNTDPFLVETINDTIKALQKTLDVIKK